MKHLNLIPFLLILLMLTASCEKNEIQTDETLENIIGTWHSASHSESRTFKRNYEFIDSLFLNYREPNQTLDCIIKGKYKIINGFIEFSDIKCTYVSTSNVYIFIFHYTTWKFEIIDNTLFMNEIGIFKPIDHPAIGINGKWQSNRIGTIYDSNQNPKSYCVNQIITINFNENTNSYIYEYKDTDVNSTKTYSDGPYNYIFENGYFYNQNSSKPFAKYDEGFILFTDENTRRIYTKK